MKSTFYVQLEPRWSTWKEYTTGKYRLEKVVATRVTTTKPSKPQPGSITVKLSVDMPVSVFEPFEPAVEITIPEPAEDLIVANVETQEQEPAE